MVDGVFGVVCCGVSGAVSSSTWHIRKSYMDSWRVVGCGYLSMVWYRKKYLSK